MKPWIQVLVQPRMQSQGAVVQWHIAPTISTINSCKQAVIWPWIADNDVLMTRVALNLHQPVGWIGISFSQPKLFGVYPRLLEVNSPLWSWYSTECNTWKSIVMTMTPSYSMHGMSVMKTTGSSNVLNQIRMIKFPTLKFCLQCVLCDTHRCMVTYP